jgi:FAD/FMN-containing dehydrogenase
MSDLVGGDTVVRPDAAGLQRHLSDYGVQGQPDPGVLALTYPRDTTQVSRILRYCNEHRIAVQPQGGMTGLSGGAVPVGPCVILSLERMRAATDSGNPTTKEPA